MDAKLIVIGGKANKSEIKLKLPTTIGRSRTADLTVAHPKVSRQHCEIYERDGALVVRDNGSLNGTFIESQRVSEAVLKPGDKLTVGPLTFIAVYSHTGDFPALDMVGHQSPHIPQMDSTSGGSIFVPVSAAQVAAKAAGSPKPVLSKPSAKPAAKRTDLPETPQFPAGTAMPSPGAAGVPPLADVPSALIASGDSGDMEDVAWLAVLEQASEADPKSPSPAPAKPKSDPTQPSADSVAARSAANHPAEDSSKDIPTVPEVSPEELADKWSKDDPDLDAFFKGLK